MQRLGLRMPFAPRISPWLGITLVSIALPACGRGANLELTGSVDGSGSVDASPSDADAKDAADGGSDMDVIADVSPGDTAAANVDADVIVKVDKSQTVGTSALVPGFSQVDNSLRYPFGNNDQAAVNAARSLVGGTFGALNQPIMAWGASDPWPDAMQPIDLSSFQAQLDVVAALGGELVVTLCEAPWWMKGQLQSDGTTYPLTANDEWASVAYSSRVLDNQMGNWLTLVQQIAQLAMLPPYNVRRFQVWNELKGYYDPITNAWDYTTSPGDPSGANAKHGYTYLYNQTYTRLKQVATSNGIAPSDVLVGGPYVVMDSGSSASVMSNPSNVTGPWGVLDQRALDVIDYWLANKVGAEFIAIDGSGSTKFGTQPTEDFAMHDKFAAVDQWIRSQPNGGSTLPIWWAEWYAAPNLLPATAQTFAAIKAYAMAQHLKAGSGVVLAWGGLGVDGPDGVDGLYTPTTSGGGGPLPWSSDVNAFHQDFAAGTRLVGVTSSSTNIEAVASAQKTMLINKTSSSLSVSVNGAETTLAPYAVAVVNTP